MPKLTDEQVLEILPEEWCELAKKEMKGKPDDKTPESGGADGGRSD